MSNDLDEKTIYEIFRACRLCGAGGGYKMPIIPSVIGFDCADIELRQKIRECLQIECHQDDKMPPLICELCIDKVNDFYEFLDMCRQTNVRTRQRLGLPIASSQPSSEDDCILGVTEPVYINDSEEERTRQPAAKLIKVKEEKKKKGKKVDERVSRLQRELDSLVQQDSMSSARSRRSHRESRDSSCSSGSRRNTRSNLSPAPDSRDQENVSLSRLKDQNKKKEVPKLTLKRKLDPSPVSEDFDDESLGYKKGQKWTSSGKLVPTLKFKTGMLQDALIKSKLTLEPSQPGPKSGKTYQSIDLSRPGPRSIKTTELASKPTIMAEIPRHGPKSTKATESALKPTKMVEIPRPGPKSTKATVLASKPTKMVEIPRPGPKSTKATESASKSTKIIETPRPGPKSTKVTELASKPTKMVEMPRPGPKSSKAPVEARGLKRPLSPVPLAKRAKPGPKPKAPSPPKEVRHMCNICEQEFQTTQGLSSHMTRIHTVKFTAPDLACNPCGEWFRNPEELTVHHKWHKNNDISYACRACPNSYKQFKAYLQHMTKSPQHSPWAEVPDVKCRECWKMFPTRVLLAQHRCLGQDSRPGGKCTKCNKYYHTHKNLKKHESACTGKKKFSLMDLKIDPSVRKRLLPMEVRLARCDPLLKRGKCNAARVPTDYGLDPTCLYPYKSLVKVKQEPMDFNGMVIINKDVRDEFYKEEDYVHWDSDNYSDSDDEFSLVNPAVKTKKLPSLTALALKTIYSKQCLGKVPKKLRKVKNDKYDSFFNPDNEFDNVQDDINNIINNLGHDNEDNSNSAFDDIVNGALGDIKDNENHRVNALINEESSVLSFDSDSLLDQNKVPASDNSVNSADLLKDMPRSNGNFDDKDVDRQTDVSAEDLLGQNKDPVDDNKVSVEDNTGSVHSADLLTGACNLNSNFEEKNDDGSQTDASNDDAVESTAQNIVDTNLGSDKISIDDILEANNIIRDTIDDKVPTIENNDNFDANLGNTDKQNGVCDDKVNGANDLISEINELYDKKLMDELDAEMGI